MAEFCLKHFNELFNKNYKRIDVILRNDLCESCGCIKLCVMNISIIGKIREKTNKSHIG